MGKRKSGHKPVVSQLEFIERIEARMAKPAKGGGRWQVSERPSDAEVLAAGAALFAEGLSHGWWPESCKVYEGLDPIGRSEFDGIVERILMAAAAARDQDSN